MTVKIQDFANPFDAIRQFEQEICSYTGAPYAVVTDCCTHAIEMVFRLRPPTETIKFTCWTYISVLMTMHKLGIKYELIEEQWHGSYQFHGTNVVDSARNFSRNMYVPGTTWCVSFGRTKPLQIGSGGCVLTDDADLAQRLQRMRYDGRDIYQYSPWVDQHEFDLGFHYYMNPELCVDGINLLRSNTLVTQTEAMHQYPDCRKIRIRG